MNAKIGIAILVAACVGLAVILVAVKKTADDQRQKAVAAATDYSNQLVTANSSLDELRQVNVMLTNDLATTRTVTQELSNNLTVASNTILNTETSLQTAQQQITNLNDRIAQLETQNQELDQRVGSLSNTIASLDTRITMTQMQLATAQTNNAFLEAELKKQVAQREELEHKFNDLKVMRAQVSKLKTDALVARRLEWIREGIDPTKPMKGGQLLMTRGTPGANAATNRPAYNLNVEVRSDGSVRVVSPPTNSVR